MKTNEIISQIDALIGMGEIITAEMQMTDLTR